MAMANQTNKNAVEQSPLLTAYSNYRLAEKGDYVGSLSLAANLYVQIAGGDFPTLMETKKEKVAAGKIYRQFFHKLEEETSGSLGKIDGGVTNLVNNFTNKLAHIRGLTSAAYYQHNKRISNTAELHVFCRLTVKLSNKDEVIKFIQQSKDNNKKKKPFPAKKAATSKKRPSPPTTKNISDTMNKKHKSNNKKTSGSSSSSKGSLTLHPAASSSSHSNTHDSTNNNNQSLIPLKLTLDPNKLFRNVMGEIYQGEVHSAMVVQRSNNPKKPCKHPFHEAEGEQETSSLIVMQHSPIQAVTYRRLDANYHQSSPFKSAVELALKYLSNTGGAINIFPNKKSHLNNNGCNQDLVVLNYGTKEFSSSAFYKSMKFDAIGLAHLMQHLIDTKSLLIKRNERGVPQWNGGFAPLHCPDVTRRDGDHTVNTLPILLALDKKYSDFEAEASRLIYSSLSGLATAAQLFVDENHTVNGQLPMDDPDRHELFGSRVGALVGSKEFRFESISVNHQFICKVEDLKGLESKRSSTMTSLSGHCDVHNCPSWDIVFTFCCFLTINENLIRQTTIFYNRRGCSHFAAKELVIARPFFQPILDYVTNNHSGSRYEDLELSPAFLNHDDCISFGKVVKVALMDQEPGYSGPNCRRMAELPADGSPPVACRKKDRIILEVKENTTFEVWVVPSFVTPRGWISSTIHAFRTFSLHHGFQLRRRHGLAFLLISSALDCQWKVMLVVFKIWIPHHSQTEGRGDAIPSAAQLLLNWEADCHKLGFHFSGGGYKQKHCPNYKATFGTLDHANSLLDKLDTHVKRSNKPLLLTSSLVDELKKMMEGTGLMGPVVTINYFQFLAAFGLAENSVCFKRAFDGWPNTQPKIRYNQVMNRLGCITHEDKMNLMGNVARKLGYPGDLKVGEHAPCKTF